MTPETQEIADRVVSMLAPNRRRSFSVLAQFIDDRKRLRDALAALLDEGTLAVDETNSPPQYYLTNPRRDEPHSNDFPNIKPYPLTESTPRPPKRPSSATPTTC